MRIYVKLNVHTLFHSSNGMRLKVVRRLLKRVPSKPEYASTGRTKKSPEIDSGPRMGKRDKEKK
jgi:hypothetical protein